MIAFLGTFNASDERSIQRFQLINNGFVKFVKIGLLSHYGSEHFCPLSVVRIFGTSLFEEVERMDSLDTHSNDDDSESPLMEEMVGEADSSQNLFGHAKEAVFNIVRQAAQALNGRSSPLSAVGSLLLISGHKETKESPPNQTESSNVRSLTDLELEAIRLYPKVGRLLNNCTKSDNISQKCLYIKAMLNVKLYELLIDQSFSCDVTNLKTNRSLFHCNSQMKNISNISIKVEPSIDVPNVDIISPTKPILEFEPKSIQTTTLTPLDGKETVVKPTEDLESTITKTLEADETTASVESSMATTAASASNDKSDETVTTAPVVAVKEPEESETSEEVSNKDATTDEIAARVNGQSQQNQVGGQNQNYLASGPALGQSKESVVIRLSSRIKALEVNLSLSSQYLEELSLRYRKQMEEMQRAFNITISKMNDTNIRAAERVREKSYLGC